MRGFNSHLRLQLKSLIYKGLCGFFSRGICGANCGIEDQRDAKRYHGSATLDPQRVGRDASRIAEEIFSHLAGQMGAEVTVTLEIQVKLPNGASDSLVRIVAENGRTLKFDSQGFERE